jgi:hypothetical protein
VYSQAKMGSGILTSMTYGIAKTKMKATLSGNKANLQIEKKKPVFYFYFEKNNTNNLVITVHRYFGLHRPPAE